MCLNNTLDNLDFDHLAIVFKCLTMRDLLMSVSGVSAYLLEMVENEAMYSRLGADFWTAVDDATVMNHRLNNLPFFPANVRLGGESCFWKYVMDMASLKQRLVSFVVCDPYAELFGVFPDHPWSCLTCLTISNSYISSLPASDTFTEHCPQLTTLKVFGCKNLTSIQNVGNVTSVYLGVLPFLVDISGLATCEFVSVVSCDAIQDFSPLSTCSCVVLEHLRATCASLAALAFVRDLKITICLEDIEGLIQDNQIVEFLDVPNHQHKRLCLDGVRVYRFDTLAQVESFLMIKCLGPDMFEAWSRGFGVSFLLLVLSLFRYRIRYET